MFSVLFLFRFVKPYVRGVVRNCSNARYVFTKPLGSRTLKGLLDSKLWNLDTGGHVTCREHEVVDVERVLSFDDDTVKYVL